MKTLIPTLALILVALLLLRRSSRRKRRAGESRFEPKASSKWNSLNNGEDPSL